ncbi:type II and III secretion system protein family protein [Pseudomonas sp. ZM23]|uniref:Type II and III secretion system protein family protein n=1 Tax=Pseudomonas triclosanedens TaxID=2961893 RepID=A0ABY7A0T5_9PSED|nr:type II and III secretion system protein family protein [Pseudomonas triclosanedens]MCP8464702.1 type II and III secretion system protein family protein [Pseudomonas triclosanedens]MCP8473633.1 type II and III secretion system protein family protein [Pseudomonas triclosanedens]MCP8478470.1 type II and III secretion system protein family protein [Pseudomonas triclosanedens]WAI50817.1 type II and III secretion system protein family protein [Pseudomonas triclosanedens]
MSKRFILSLAVLLACAVHASAQAVPSACAGFAGQQLTLDLEQGAQRDQQLPVPIRRLAIGDPNIADVQVLDKRDFLVTGKAQGLTSLLIWTACGDQPMRTVVRVGSRAVSDAGGQPADMAAGLPNQVQTDIRFVEVSRSKLKQASASLLRRGSNFFGIGSPGSAGHINGSISDVLNNGVRDLANGTGGAIESTLNSGFNIVWGGGSSKWLGFINALEGSGFAYTLARPSLVATSGQSASFLAGGEFPIPVPNGDKDTITIEYKEFGVRLTLTPTVMSDRRIALKVAPEVSELDFSAGIRTNDISVPALTVRRTDTSVMLADGESFVISGLISSSTISNVDKFPFLGNLPIIGALFRSSSLSKDDRELLMVVTPRLVQPLAANAALPTMPGEGLRKYDPGFGEFYFLENGRFDGRKASSGLSR